MVSREEGMRQRKENLEKKTLELKKKEEEVIRLQAELAEKRKNARIRKAAERKAAERKKEMLKKTKKLTGAVKTTRRRSQKLKKSKIFHAISQFLTS